jgi:hypothetical protein
MFTFYLPTSVVKRSDDSDSKELCFSTSNVFELSVGKGNEDVSFELERVSHIDFIEQQEKQDPSPSIVDKQEPVLVLITKDNTVNQVQGSRAMNMACLT